MHNARFFYRAAKERDSLTENATKLCKSVAAFKKEDNLVLNCAAEVYLKRVSVIWSSPLSDHNRITATNQFALLVLAYLMGTQKWLIVDLQQLDRETRKIIVENGGKHPLGSKALLYLP